MKSKKATLTVTRDTAVWTKFWSCPITKHWSQVTVEKGCNDGCKQRVLHGFSTQSSKQIYTGVITVHIFDCKVTCWTTIQMAAWTASMWFLYCWTIHLFIGFGLLDFLVLEIGFYTWLASRTYISLIFLAVALLASFSPLDLMDELCPSRHLCCQLSLA